MSMQSVQAAPLSLTRAGRDQSSSLARAARRVGSLLKKAMDAICAHKQRKATAAILSALDDHALRDIGLTRFDVTGVSPRRRSHGPLAPHCLHF